MILFLQLDNEKESGEILFDNEGLQLLRDIINKDWKEPFKKENDLYDLDHEHLSSKEWGGDELTPEFTSKGSLEIQSLKIVYLGKNATSLLL